jgi:hypothetical protein
MIFSIKHIMVIYTMKHELKKNHDGYHNLLMRYITLLFMGTSVPSRTPTLVRESAPRGTRKNKIASRKVAGLAAMCQAHRNRMNELAPRSYLHDTAMQEGIACFDSSSDLMVIFGENWQNSR